MSKTTFLQRFERTNNFYSNALHHHKATFKGLGEFYERYTQIQRKYSNDIMKLSESCTGDITDFSKELAFIQSSIKELASHLQHQSQLHHNYSERLHQICEFYREEYQQSKRLKEKMIKLLKDKNKDDYDVVKEGKNRNMLNEKEMEICKSLYDALDTYMEEETHRTNKIKEQIVIYFSVTKKQSIYYCRIHQKELELSTAYSSKIAQADIEVKVPQIHQIQNILIDQYNGYGSQAKLVRKERDVNRPLTINRDSLRESMLMKEKMMKLQTHQTKLHQIVEKYQQMPNKLNRQVEPEYLVGVFDTKIIKDYRVYAREINIEQFRQISFGMLQCFYADEDNEEIRTFLEIMKSNLRVRGFQSNKIKKYNKIEEFIVGELGDKDNGHFIGFMVLLSSVYDGTSTASNLNTYFSASSSTYPLPALKRMSHTINCSIIDALLQSVIIVRETQPILYDQYIEMVKIVCKFSSGWLNVNEGIVIGILLRKIERVVYGVNSEINQKVQDLLQQKFNLSKGNIVSDFQQTNEEQIYENRLSIHLLNRLTQRISTFARSRTPLIVAIKILLTLQKIGPRSLLSTARQHMSECIKLAGWRYLQECDQSGKLGEGEVYRGQERLKNLVEILEQTQYDSITEIYLDPTASELSSLLGIGKAITLSKMKLDFSSPMYELLQANLLLIYEVEGIDREGYVLRLGIYLAKIDIWQPRDLPVYAQYFSVLQKYLASTEKDYQNILEHSRKTELWIAEENSQATQNCIDFCSLLYKPFEFLLTSLKKLEEEKSKTEFTVKYAQLIKLKLNNVLKDQILQYITFLYDSLSVYTFQQPQLTLKPKRMQLSKSNPEATASMKYGFKESTRRLYNLIFLKDQLQEIISDFIDSQTYAQLNYSIYNIDALQRLQAQQHKQILGNVKQIVKGIQNMEVKIVERVASISVFHFMKSMWANLYYQEEKNAIEEFFSSKEDYKLSEYTLVKLQNELEEILATIGKNIPQELLDSFNLKFIHAFFIALRYEILNLHKFKIPIPIANVVNYLDKDIHFVASILKQRFITPKLVAQELEKPVKELLRDLESPTNKVMGIFEEGMLKNNKESSRYALVILNLRVKDERAEEFVKKFKNIALK